MSKYQTALSCREDIAVSSVQPLISIEKAITTQEYAITLILECGFLSFLHQPHAQQLGELAASLARLKSWLQKSASQEVVPVLLSESLLYLSLLQRESQINSELDQLQGLLQHCQQNWINSWANSTETANIADIVPTWSQRVLAMSSVLTSESMSA
ncbi:hypothetical protein [Nostoc sp.]|uniref:hypothetical protein n=1 Tax=Nostoc sp. TaxID=1180 RepID=UPI002FF5502C